jgi:quercetin dioxygenase-like cupin family protein
MKSELGNLLDYSKPALWNDKPKSWREVMPGVHRRIVAHSLTGMMVMYKIESEKVFPLHDHAHAQYGIFLEGSGVFKVGNSSWKVKKGDSYYIPPGVRHELKIDSKETSVMIDFFTPRREDYLAEAVAPDG